MGRKPKNSKPASEVWNDVSCSNSRAAADLQVTRAFREQLRMGMGWDGMGERWVNVNRKSALFKHGAVKKARLELRFEVYILYFHPDPWGNEPI